MKNSNDQKEFLLLKIKSPEGIDFFHEHNDIIAKYGYVDFAKVGKYYLKTDSLNSGDIIFIKESIVNGGALYSAVINDIVEKGKKYPSYYKDYDTLNKIWIRIKDLKKIEKSNFLDDYETRAGGEVIKAIRSMSPNFFIHKKES